MSSNPSFYVRDLKPTDYNAYYGAYLKLVGDGTLLQALDKCAHEIGFFLDTIDQQQFRFSYAPGKWTVGAVVLHLIDTERIFQYRALRFARNDHTELQGFDQDDFVMESRAEERTKESLISEFQAVRKSSIALFSQMDGTILRRGGRASGSRMSVGALAFLICGHQIHHFNIIGERYL